MESPVRSLLVRSEKRMIAGVSGGLSAHLGIPLNYVRLGFIALTALGGIGAVLYAWLWVFVPSAEEAQADEIRSWGTRTRSLAEEMTRVQQGIFRSREGLETNSSWREILIGARAGSMVRMEYSLGSDLAGHWNSCRNSFGLVAT